MMMRNKLKSLLAVIVLLVGLIPYSAFAEGPSDPAPAISPAGTANGKSILFDNAHAQTAGAADWVIDGGFSDFANALAGQGYYVKELRKSSAITLADLQGYDVFVIPEANIPFKTSEQAAMLQYVQNGGSIFFIADHYNADRNKNRWDASEVFNGYRRGAWSNPALGMSAEEAASAAMSGVASSDWLSANFGMRIRYNAIGDANSGTIVASSQAFGITSGVSSVTMHAGSTIAITDPTKAKGIVYIQNSPAAWSSAVDQGVYNGGGTSEGPYVAVAKAQLGKVAVIGDSSAVEDSSPKYLKEETGGTKTTYDGFTEASNGTLLVNLVNWLATPESYTSLSSVSGLTLDTATTLLSMETPSASTEPQSEPWAAPASGYKWYDSSTFKSGSYGYGSGSGGGGTGTGNESFETGTKTAYTSASVTLGSGAWYFDNALLGDSATDKKNGTKSARIRAAGSIAMSYDVAGAASVTLSHANFGTDSGANWKLQKSTNGGSTWTDVGSTYTSGSSLAAQTIPVGETGSVRFKIVVGGTSGQRINIDDFSITAPSVTPTGSLSETYESGSKTAYTAAGVTLDSGTWYFDNALIGESSTDKKNGGKSARIRSAGSIAMSFDVPGASAVTVKHANFGTDTGVTWKLQKSSDGGSTWTDVGSAYTSGSALATQTITVGATGNVRFRIVVGGTSGQRINIDDFVIS
ncbi:GldG family protein [Cohnella sp. AR92]|uniref:GldG family protein n=1 Tax=Cohnella sp. AR92 TaxID=648716 RepID=UPI001EE03529|nr:GldG family protein [Cohnella sp. AR92]